jgi:hypothetical protein
VQGPYTPSRQRLSYGAANLMRVEKLSGQPTKMVALDRRAPFLRDNAELFRLLDPLCENGDVQRGTPKSSADLKPDNSLFPLLREYHYAARYRQ